MKKIIYSLVIMIAAGSLFTSCIEQVEPLGIQDMRLAKAEYIRALKDLRAADAEYRRAEAAVQLAIARYEDALTAKVNAETEYQKLLNEYQALLNEARSDTNEFNRVKIANEIDKIQKEMEVRVLEHQRNLAKAEKEMRLAKEDLRVTIRNINLACGDLTANEKVAIYEAAAVYYWLTEKSILYVDSVFQAQQTVDTLKEYKARFADTAWDGQSLVLNGVIEKYEADIAAEYEKIDMLMEQYENLPDTSATVAEWKAVLDEFDKAKDAVKLDSTKMEAEKAAYESFLKESIRDFDVAIAEWIEENWKNEKDTNYVQPAISAGDKPTEAEYTSKNADSLKFVLTRPKTVDEGPWAKFIYLMTSYTDDPFPASKNKPTKTPVITIKGDTATIVVDAAMKDFILGAAGNGEKSQKYQDSLVANYGLLGIYDILVRDKVIGETEAPTAEEIAKAKEAMDKAEKKWNDDRQILIDGIADFDKFIDADADLVEEVKENGEGAQKMVKAIKDLKTAIKATGTKFASFDGNDSAKLFDAIVEFAQAREEYLAFTCATSADKIDPENPAKRDSSVFYYSDGKSGAGKAMFASKKFSALTYSELKDGKYNFLSKEPGDRFYVDTVTTGTITDVDTVVNAFANILSQMGNLVNIFDFDADTVNPDKIDVTDTLSSALYGKYKVVGGWGDPKEIRYLNGDEYVPEDLADAIDDYYKAIKAYYQAYSDFWADTVKLSASDTAAVKAYIQALKDNKKVDEKKKAVVDTVMKRAKHATEKLDPECYTKGTFKPYEDEAPIVYFVGDSIVPTEALSAVLNSVDPKVKGKGDKYVAELGGENPVVNNTRIFKDEATDFYKYMKAASNYYDLTNAKASENLAGIRAAIKKVEDGIQKDIDQAGKLDEEKYKAAVEKWEKDKAAADEYFEAKKAFTGVKEVDAKGNEILNDVYAIVKPGKGGRDTAVAGKTAKLKGNGIEVLFAKNILGLYSGWNPVLGGKQLELAIELFGEEPWEEYNEYMLHQAQYGAQISDLADLQASAEEVYMAKAKVEGLLEDNTSGNGQTTIDKLYEKYLEAYTNMRNKIVKYDEYGNVTGGKVKKCLDNIDKWSHEMACYKSDVPYWDGLISAAQNELDVLKNRQKIVNQNLSVAKENFDRIREYLLSQDGVSYVIPISTADVDDVIMNLNYIVKQFGYTIAEVAAMVTAAISAD